MKKGIVTKLGDVQLALLCPLVKGGYIFHHIVEGDALGIYMAIDHSIKNKSVIGTRTEAESQFHIKSKVKSENLKVERVINICVTKYFAKVITIMLRVNAVFYLKKCSRVTHF